MFLKIFTFGFSVAILFLKRTSSDFNIRCIKYCIFPDTLITELHEAKFTLLLRCTNFQKYQAESSQKVANLLLGEAIYWHLPSVPFETPAARVQWLTCDLPVPEQVPSIDPRRFPKSVSLHSQAVPGGTTPAGGILHTQVPVPGSSWQAPVLEGRKLIGYLFHISISNAEKKDTEIDQEVWLPVEV